MSQKCLFCCFTVPLTVQGLCCQRFCFVPNGSRLHVNVIHSSGYMIELRSVLLCSIILCLKHAHCTAQSNNFGSRLLWCTAHLTASAIVLFHLSAIQFCWGSYSGVASIVTFMTFSPSCIALPFYSATFSVCSDV